MVYPGIAARAERLRHTPWTALLGAAWLILLGCVFLRLILPRTLVDALHPLLKAAPLLPFMAKDLSHLPDALARTREALALRDWRALVLAWLPPEFVGLLRLGRAQRRGFMNWVLRRPQAAMPIGQPFGYLERGSYRTAIAIVLLATLVELPLNAAILSMFIKSLHARQVLHLLLLGAGVSSLVWVLGDRWLVGAGRHVLDDDGLQLRIGARTTGTIPGSAIAACEPVTVPVAEWCRQRGIARRHTLLASPLDKPNAVLILVPDSCVRLSHLGVQRSSLCCVFLYLDRPHEFILAIGKA